MIRMELKPCPFCKTKDLTIKVSSAGDMWVLCNFCKTSGPVTEIEGVGDLEYWANETISDWNDRTS